MAKCREKDEPYLFREKEKAPFSQLFFLSRLSYKCALLLIIFAITTEPILRYLTKLLCWIEKKDMKC